MYYKEVIPASGVLQLPTSGRLFLLDSIGVAPSVRVILSRQNTAVFDADGMVRGTRRFDDSFFDLVRIEGAAGALIKFFVGNEDVQISMVGEQVFISNTAANPVPCSIAGAVNVTVTEIGVNNTAANPVPVTGALTDAQLRAAAVPVTGGLTDAQLRAAAVPVTGGLTDAQLRAAAVPVTGALTDAQLRAAAVVTNRENGVYAQTQVSVTNVNTLLLAASATRRYVFVQNNSLAGVMRLQLDGVAPSATKGLRLQPGDSWESPDFCLNNAIRGFMETADATANNVEVVFA